VRGSERDARVLVRGWVIEGRTSYEVVVADCGSLPKGERERERERNARFLWG
jgi:hypothetical protein